MNGPIQVVPFEPAFEADIVALLNREIREGYAHFGLEEWTVGAFAESLDPSLPLLVGVSEGAFAGFATCSKWKPRGAYGRTVELGVYVDPRFQGQGVGSSLLVQMIETCRDLGMHTLLAGIAQPNPMSVRLFEKQGFSHVGVLPEVGFKLGEWRSVGYWARVLEP